MKYIIFILLLVPLAIGAQDISDAHWQFREAQDTVWRSASVPGVVHLDLLAHHIIDDPYYETNEIQQRWIEEKDWVYRSSFTLVESQLSHNNIELIFEGLDTYADVYINDSLMLKADNMFRTWNVDIKDIAQAQNTIEIYFHSPINYNRQKVKSHPYKLPSGNEPAEIEDKVYSFTRKAAYHFGWDWGPRFVTAGIYKAVKIHTWSDAQITDLHCETISISDSTAEMKATATIEADHYLSDTMSLTLGDTTIQFLPIKGSQKISHTFTVTQPKLWWCNGLGEARLYTLQAQLQQGDNFLDTDSVRYGIRTIEVVNEADEIGTSFYFKLNGRPVFMKGGNYIPQDIFLPRVGDDRYEKLLKQIQNANMNMIRVWGGGIYEKDIFYDLCDEFGILVWQDFMFAGSLYPTDTAFLQNIKSEVKEQVTRLRSHPCIALWCGNNEIEVAWHNWGWQKQYGYDKKDAKVLWGDYQKIFHQLIPETLSALDSTRHYTTTSPLSNWGTAENFNHSTMHYWGVWHGKEPFENFENNVGRFMVEYGFQSFPSMATLQKVIPKSSLYLESPAMQHRQKSYIGNGLISQHIDQYFDAPKSFSEFVELSQKTQALGMGMAIDAHMKNQSHCMGTLFWQINDCWPGPSWSIIDYYGLEKEAYKVVKQKFELDSKE